jgi:hypothetical protein
MVEHLPNKCDVLRSNPTATKKVKKEEEKEKPTMGCIFHLPLHLGEVM